jgi:G3E family GTPase
MTVERPLPVALLTGFLGAGKTTALNRWLAAPSLARTLVLMNEVGAIAIDHHLIREVRDDVVVLASGCVCCSVRSDLAEALAAVDPSSFDRVVIETTGLADPAPVIATLLGDRTLAARFDLDRVVTVVDVERGRDLLERFPEARNQVALADVLLVTKIDRADEDRAAALSVRLRRWNSLAAVVRGDLALGAEVLVDPAFSRRGAWAPEHAAPAPAAPPRGRRLPFAPDSTPGPETRAHAEHAHAGLRTVALPTPEPVSVRRLALWLEMIARFHGDHLLRAKALLRDAESGEVWCLHAVQHAVNPPERVAALEDLPPEALGLVLISVGAERGVFESLVASARAIALPPSVPS